MQAGNSEVLILGKGQILVFSIFKNKIPNDFKGLLV